MERISIRAGAERAGLTWAALGAVTSTALWRASAAQAAVRDTAAGKGGGAGGDGLQVLDNANDLVSAGALKYIGIMLMVGVLVAVAKTSLRIGLMAFAVAGFALWVVSGSALATLQGIVESLGTGGKAG